MHQRFASAWGLAFRRRLGAAVLLAFAIAFAEFSFLHADPTYADPDSFYHAQIAVRLGEHGLVRDFPWLAQTVLGDAYIDHHFLYHLALVPFVTLLPPLVGLKLATVVFAALAVATFHWLLRKLDVRHAWIYTGVLLVSNPFIFRIGLAKAQALSLIALLLLIWLVLQRRTVAVAALSFVYVWLYGGWPLAGVVVAAYVAAGIPSLWAPDANGRHHLHRSHLRTKLREDAKLIAAVGGGLIAGLVCSPYFPTNLIFYWHQIVEVAVVNYRTVIGVGGEWYPYPPLELLAATSIAALLALVAGSLFVMSQRYQTARTRVLGLLALLLVALTLRSRRNVEYAIPFTILFAAVTLDRLGRVLNAKGFAREVLAFAKSSPIVLAGMLTPLFLFPVIILRDVAAVRSAYAQGQPFDRFGPALRWLKATAPAGETVFHSDWDEFPQLFFHDDAHAYIVGLDPTFLYKQDRDKYTLWLNATTAKLDSDELHRVVAVEFRARYVLTTIPRHATFDTLVASNPAAFVPIYRDAEVAIYRVSEYPLKPKNPKS